MKNKSLLFVALAMLLLGFALAWIIKPQAVMPTHDHEAMTSSGKDQIWTCSMHPQIRQNEPGDCPICGMDLIPLAENTSSDPLVLQMTNEAVQLANIQTTTVGVDPNGPSSGKTIRLSGKVKPDERLAATQVAHVPGRIEKLFVSFTGEQIRQGQPLVTIYSPELITAQRELLEAVKLRELNPGLVEAARNKLKYLKIDEATIEEIIRRGTIQESFTLKADATGIVTNRRVSVGDYVKQGEALFELMNLQRVWVLFDAYEEDLAFISVGDRIEFTTPSLPGQSFSTRVSFIDPFINPQTRVASVRTEVNNSRGLLKPEMLVYGVLQQRPSSTAPLTIPRSAVLWTGKRSVVYTKVPDAAIPSFKYREITLGEVLGDRYVVLTGLEAGEEIVSYGSFTIDAAAQLNNQASMINRDVSIKGQEATVQLPDFTELTPIEFKAQLSLLTENYLQLKDALVATDPKMAAETARELTLALNTINPAFTEEEALPYWEEQLREMQAHAEAIAATGEVEKQRQQFDFLSRVLIHTLRVFGVSENTFFIQHCPMVNNNDGADWISKEKEIRNPYYGDEMLTCGVVRDTLGVVVR